MWIPNKTVQQIDKFVRIFYLSGAAIKPWNDQRKPGEIRMLTGWCWMSHDGKQYRQGFKSATVCYRDAYYAIVKRTKAPLPDSGNKQKDK